MQFLTFAVVLAARHERIPIFLSVYDYWYFCPLTTLFDAGSSCCRKFHGSWCVTCLPRRFRLIQQLLLGMRQRLFDYFLTRIDRFIVLSKSSASILEAYGVPATKAEIIPHVVAPAEYRAPKDGNRQRFVLFVGWLQKRKGLHILLAAMRAVWAKKDDIALCAVVQDVKHEDEYRRAIEREFAAIGHARLQVYRGRQEKTFIRGLVAGAAVVAVPEQWENMSPIIIMEAMQCGACVVASDIGGIGEFIRHGVDGFLAESGNPADFADKILYALDNPQACERCGQSARERIARLSDQDALSQRLSKEYAQWMKR
jgi:glycosyltransferase involved in cell wall biosynthesis